MPAPSRRGVGASLLKEQRPASARGRAWCGARVEPWRLLARVPFPGGREVGFLVDTDGLEIEQDLAQGDVALLF